MNGPKRVNTSEIPVKSYSITTKFGRLFVPYLSMLFLAACTGICLSIVYSAIDDTSDQQFFS